MGTFVLILAAAYTTALLILGGIGVAKILRADGLGIIEEDQQ